MFKTKNGVASLGDSITEVTLPHSHSAQDVRGEAKKPLAVDNRNFGKVHPKLHKTISMDSMLENAFNTDKQTYLQIQIRKTKSKSSLFASESKRVGDSSSENDSKASALSGRSTPTPM